MDVVVGGHNTSATLIKTTKLEFHFTTFVDFCESFERFDKIVEIYIWVFLLNFQFVCRDRKEIEETLRDMVAAMIEELIEPSKHGIEAKAD